MALDNISLALHGQNDLVTNLYEILNLLYSYQEYCFNSMKHIISCYFLFEWYLDNDTFGF
jgi:hypothetical protein